MKKSTRNKKVRKIVQLLLDNEPAIDAQKLARIKDLVEELEAIDEEDTWKRIFTEFVIHVLATGSVHFAILYATKG